jgi:hypothetical protein
MNSLLLTDMLIAVLVVAPRIAIPQIADSVLTGTQEIRDFQAVRELRLAQFFVIGEKSVEPDAKQLPPSVLLRTNEVVSGVRYLEDNSDINAFSILDIKLRVDNWVLPTLKDPNGIKFTLGLVHSLIPSLRQNFGVFFGWHDLKDPCFGVTFSPSINFKVLVGAEGQKKE